MRQLLLLLFCAFVPLLSMAQEGWQGEWQGGKKDSGPHRHPRGNLSGAHHHVAKVQAVAALSAGRAEFRGYPYPCRQLSRRYPGLHPGGREQAEGHGGELPHLASSADETDRGGAAEGGIHLDYHHLDFFFI